MLSALEQKQATRPWSLTREELFNLLEKLSSPVSWRVFGDAQFGIVAEIHKAAVTRNLPIPENFGKEIRALPSRRRV